MKTERYTISVNLTPKQFQALTAKAKADDRSRSSLVRLAVAMLLGGDK